MQVIVTLVKSELFPKTTIQVYNIVAFIAGVLFYCIFLKYLKPAEQEQKLDKINVNELKKKDAMDITPQEKKIVNLFFGSLVLLNMLYSVYFITSLYFPHLMIIAYTLSAIVPWTGPVIWYTVAGGPVW